MPCLYAGVKGGTSRLASKGLLNLIKGRLDQMSSTSDAMTLFRSVGRAGGGKVRCISQTQLAAMRGQVGKGELVPVCREPRKEIKNTGGRVPSAQGFGVRASQRAKKRSRGSRGLLSSR